MKQLKAFFAAAVMMTMSSTMMAQTTVKGVLMDETLGESEPFATVRVFKAGGHVPHQGGRSVLSGGEGQG